METFKIQINDKAKSDKLKTFLKSLQVTPKIEKGYNPEFVKKIKQSEKEFMEGKGVAIKTPFQPLATAILSLSAILSY